MKIGSLFSGVGGLELGLEWAGVGETVWQVERDRFCRGVLARHWPNARRHDDVRRVGKANLEPVDLVCGGFPCQDISQAGRGAGLAGSRSGLWFEYQRIVDELHPNFVVVENVPALVARGLDSVVGGLERLGYVVYGRQIAAADVGAPHRRPRVFLVAIADGNGRESLATLHSKEGDVDEQGRHYANRCGGRPTQSRVGGSAHGVPDRVDPWPARRGDPRAIWEPSMIARGRNRLRRGRLRALGNAVVPQVAEVVGRFVLDLAEGRA